MTRRRLAAALLCVAALLFAGRWAASLLAQRLWAAPFGVAAVQWMTRTAVLRLLLDLSASLLASVWFCGHLVVVVRGVERVQLSRGGAEGAGRDAVSPATLIGIALITGAVLGLLVGGDLSASWPTVALAWQGVRFGMTEPLMGQDLGIYAAQLPFWMLLQGFLATLAAGALLLTTVLYAAIGALRWSGGAAAITDHARRHLGCLAAALALVLGLGYLLEPLVWLTSGPESSVRGAFTYVELGAPVLTGFALATALLSLLWAFRGRPAVFAAGWLLLLLASMTLSYVVPSLRLGGASGPRDPVQARAIAALPVGMQDLQDTVPVAAATDAPARPSLWSARAAGRAVAYDTLNQVVLADLAPLDGAGSATPGWLILRQSAKSLDVLGIQDDRTGLDGAPLPSADGNVRARLALDALRPGAAPLVTGPEAHGALLGSRLQRILLAWALQAPHLLGDLPSGTRGTWILDPRQRMAALLPFAEWGDPALRIVEGRALWVVPGYVFADAFPLSEAVPWRDGRVAYVRAAFLGVLDAETGVPRVVLRPDAGPLGDAWAAIVGPLIEPWSALPSAVRRTAPYPAALLAAQARVLERDQGTLGRLVVAGQSGQLLDAAWRSELDAPVRTAIFETPDGRELSAVLEGQSGTDGARLVLRRFAAEALPAPSSLPARWSRLATFAQLRDSVLATRGSFDEGPVRLTLDGGRPVAVQSWFARRDDRSPARLAWVSVAAGERLGAGRSFAEAWENLRGGTVPAPAGQGGASIDAARRWVRAADQALRRGDLQGFARAFDALKAVLETVGAPARR